MDFYIYHRAFHKNVDLLVATFSTLIFRTGCEKATSQICAGYKNLHCQYLINVSGTMVFKGECMPEQNKGSYIEFFCPV